MKTTKRVSYDSIVVHGTWTDDDGVVHNTQSAEEVHVIDNDLDIPELTEQERLAGKKVDIQFVSGAEAVASVVEAVTKTARGELQMNTNRGIPYLDAVLGTKDKDQITDWAAYTQQAIIETNGVTGISGFSYSVEKEGKHRSVTYTVDIKTAYGATTIGSEKARSTVKSFFGGQQQYSPQASFYTFTPPVFAYEGGGSDNAPSIVALEGYGAVDSIEYRPLDTEEAWTTVTPNGAGEYSVRAHVVTTGKISEGYVTSNDWRITVYSNVSAMTFSVTTVTGMTATIRLTTSATGTVVWGDGSTSSVSGSGTKYASHTYASEGVYLVCVMNATWFAVGDDRSVGDTTKAMVTRFKKWGSGVTSASYSFAGCTNLVQETIPEWSSGMTNIEHCYDGCTGLGTTE